MILSISKPAISDYSLARVQSHAKNRTMDLYLLALSSYLPIAEAIVIGHMSRYLKRFSEQLTAEEKQLIQDFIQQESNHSRYHLKWNQSVIKQNPRLRDVFQDFDKMNQKVLALVEKRHGDYADLQPSLFDTCAFELVTSSYAAVAMRYIIPFLQSTERELWRWHCDEEIEHAFVSEVFYRKGVAVSRGYRLKIMARVILVLNGLMLQRMFMAAKADRNLSLMRLTFDFARFCLQAGGLLHLNILILRGFGKMLK